MQKELGSPLSLEKLFCTSKGRKVLFTFLQTTEIATQRWLLRENELEEED